MLKKLKNFSNRLEYLFAFMMLNIGLSSDLLAGFDIKKQGKGPLLFAVIVLIAGAVLLFVILKKKAGSGDY